MVELQEIITRGRFLFSGAPRKLEVFKLINGKLSGKEIARKVGRSQSAILQDIAKLRDFEFIVEKKDKNGETIKKEGSIVYEKTPLAKHINYSYFESVANTRIIKKKSSEKIKASVAHDIIHVPSKNEILDICKGGEDQLYEFKSPGTKTEKITKEIAAFLHTKRGGILFYGIEDDGSILGSDLKRQDIDQKVQNSIRNTVSPQPSIKIIEKTVMGSSIILIIISPWDRKTFYQYTKSEKYYIRKGTNVFALSPDEIKKLSKGEYII